MEQGKYQKDTSGNLHNTAQSPLSSIGDDLGEGVLIKYTTNRINVTKGEVSSLLQSNSQVKSRKIPIVRNDNLETNQEVTIYPISALSQNLLEKNSLDFLFFELPNGDIISIVLTAVQDKKKIYTIRHGIVALYNTDGEITSIMQFPPFSGITLACITNDGEISLTSTIIKKGFSSGEKNLSYNHDISLFLSQEDINTGKITKTTPSQLGEIQLRDKESFPNLTCTVQHIGVSTIGKEIFYVDVSDQDGNSIFQCEYRKYRESNTESPLFDKRILYIGGMLNGSGDEELLKKVTCWLLVHSEDLGMPEDTLLLFFRDDTHKYTSKIRTIGYYKNKYLNY